jgi:hypothetical protein
MTQKVNPSPQRPASSFKTAGAIAYGGGSQDGYVVPNNETTEIAIQDQDITNTGINQFTETSSSSSFDVSIDGGEAFVFGAWVCTDTTTTITLAQNTSNQKVFVGWNKSASDNVIIGTESTFSITPGDTDQKIPLYSYDTDSNGVTNVTDKRQIGKSQEASTLSVADELGIPIYSDSTNAPQTEGNVIVVDGSGSKSAGLYSHDGSSYIKAGNTEEKIEDIVVGLITGGNKVSTTYDDANDTLTVNTSALDTEEVEDTVSSLVSSDSNLSWSYDDAGNTLTVSLSNSVSTNSVTLSELMEMGSATEPSTPSDDDVALWNSGNAVEAKFSDGSTVTIAQE